VVLVNCHVAFIFMQQASRIILLFTGFCSGLVFVHFDGKIKQWPFCILIKTCFCLTMPPGFRYSCIKKAAKKISKPNTFINKDQYVLLDFNNLTLTAFKPFYSADQILHGRPSLMSLLD
jgi:hypothetical protein